MLRWLILLVGTLNVLAPAPAGAGQVADRVRAEGVLHCGAVERPGIAENLPSGAVGGVAVDVCRAVAIAVLGAAGRVSFSLYDAPHSFDGVRQGADELAFLTGSEIADAQLGGTVLPGPIVVVTRIGVMVPDDSPVRNAADLSGQTVCLMIGSQAQRALEAAAARQSLSISRLAFQEDVELLDAYNAGRCGATVGEETQLAEMRQTPGVRRIESRILPDELANDPVIAVTNKTDGAWAACVAWVFNELLLAGRRGGAWQPGGFPLGDLLGFRPEWQREVAAAIGSYDAIIRRDFTDRLGLAAGPNAIWPKGVLLPVASR